MKYFDSYRKFFIFKELKNRFRIEFVGTAFENGHFFKGRFLYGRMYVRKNGYDIYDPTNTYRRFENYSEVVCFLESYGGEIEISGDDFRVWDYEPTPCEKWELRNGDNLSLSMKFGAISMLLRSAKTVLKYGPNVSEIEFSHFAKLLGVTKIELVEQEYFYQILLCNDSGDTLETDIDPTYLSKEVIKKRLETSDREYVVKRIVRYTRFWLSNEFPNFYPENLKVRREARTLEDMRRVLLYGHLYWRDLSKDQY